MKKTSKKRLTLARDTVRALALEPVGEQIRGAAPKSGNTPTVNTCVQEQLPWVP